MTDYIPTGNPFAGSRGVSSVIKNELDSISDAINSKQNLDGLATVSLTPITIPSPPATINMVWESGKDFFLGYQVLIVDAANPTVNNMTGIILSYNSSTGYASISISSKNGSGTISSWNIGMSTYALPDQTGNNGKIITTNGTGASWSEKINSSVTKFADGTDNTKQLEFDTSGLTPGSTKTIIINNTAFTFTDQTDKTKRIALDLSDISASTTRNVVARNKNIVLVTPGTEWLQTVSASSSAAVDITGFDNATFDDYIIIVKGLVPATNNVSIYMQMTVGGVLYSSTNYLSHVATSTSAAGTYVGLGQTTALMCNALTNTAAHGLDATININDAASTTRYHKVYWNGSWWSITGPNIAMSFGSAVCNAGTGALTAIRFVASSGNISTGTFNLYGVRTV